MLCLVTQSYPTLCDPVDCSLPGTSVYGDSPGKNTGVGCHALLERIFPTQGWNPGLLRCRQILYCLSWFWSNIAKSHNYFSSNLGTGALAHIISKHTAWLSLLFFFVCVCSGCNFSSFHSALKTSAPSSEFSVAMGPYPSGKKGAQCPLWDEHKVESPRLLRQLMGSDG